MRKKNNDFAMGCVAYAILFVLLMPLVGIWLLCLDNQEAKIAGAILLIVGIILWIYFFIV